MLSQSVSQACPFVSGSGVPCELARDPQNAAILPNNIPSRDNAAQWYTQQGGSLTAYGIFGIDPLKESPHLVARRDQWLAAAIPSYEDIFSNVVSGDGELFKRCIITCIDVTNRLLALI